MNFDKYKALTRLGMIAELSFMISLIGGFLSPVTQAADNLHLLGFVDRLCHQEVYCFELRVEQVYSGAVVDRVKVYYDSTSQIFDPENYALTLAQSRIVEGSHLRLLLENRSGSYRASFIWIGD